MVSFPIDQGQEAAGIEVQVIMVRVWVQTAVRSSEKQGEEAELSEEMESASFLDTDCDFDDCT